MAAELEEFLNRAGQRPYRELVGYRRKRTATRKLQKAVLDETAMLPKGIQPYVIEYAVATDLRFGYDQAFWAQATGKQAFDAMRYLLCVSPILHQPNANQESSWE